LLGMSTLLGSSASATQLGEAVSPTDGIMRYEHITELTPGKRHWAFFRDVDNVQWMTMHEMDPETSP
ncbi:MAG TPA: hypothetical protein V6D20_20685, partial [Candidatus Obscuribacterales bacterium]